MTLNGIQDEIIQDFFKFQEWFDKYEYLIKLGKEFEPLGANYKTEENLISGCQSQVWLKAEMKGNKIQFYADSDAMIIKGILALILRVVNDQTPEDVCNANLYFIDRIGLKSNLSPARSSGVASIIKRIKESAKNERRKLYK